MGTPYQLYDLQQPDAADQATNDLEQHAGQSNTTLASALLNQQQNGAPQPQVQPPEQAQQAPGGPVKSGLRGVLLQIMHNVMAGGLPAAGYPGDLIAQEQERRQAALNESRAITSQANAQTANLESETKARNVQNRPIVLTDPQTGSTAFDAAGNPRIGTLADQKELDEMYKATGGYINVPSGLAASIGMPELAGKPMPSKTFNDLLTTQNSKTIESEIARLSQFELSKGRDPLQSPDVQSLVQIRRQLQNFNPSMADEQYRELYAKQHSGGQLTAGEQGWMKAYEREKTLAPMARLQLQMSGGGLIPQGGATPGATVDQVPAPIKGQVQSILDYRQPMPPMGRNNPTNQALQYWVNAIDPTYDATTFPARNAVLRDYTTGATSKSLSAINTSLGHLGELAQAAQLVNQNNLPALHALAAKLGAASGDDAATTYTNILHRVSPELTTAYLASGGALGERGANESDFDISKGAQQITSNIAESAKLLRSKIEPQEQNWNNTFRPTRPQDQFETRFITPAAKATLDRFSAQAPTSRSASGFSVTAPNGKTYSFNSQSDLDNFKKQAGIQ